MDFIYTFPLGKKTENEQNSSHSLKISIKYTSLTRNTISMRATLRRYYRDGDTGKRGYFMK